MKKVAIVAGFRTPFCKSFGVFKNLFPHDLGAIVVKELTLRSGVRKVDELIIGNAITGLHGGGFERIITLRGGLPESTPALTVRRNCASGHNAVTIGVEAIKSGSAEIILAAGVESMSQMPIQLNKETRQKILNLARSKGLKGKMSNLLGLYGNFMPWVLSETLITPGLKCENSGLNMGQTAEKIRREFNISREEQDEFAINSHAKVIDAQKRGRFQREIIPVFLANDKLNYADSDDGVRNYCYYFNPDPQKESEKKETALKIMSELKPAYDKYGTITAGNTSQVTDGAAAVILMPEEKALAEGFVSLATVHSYAYAGFDPSRMGLGPVPAIKKALDLAGLKLKDIGLIEINEAFAAQVLAVIRACDSKLFFEKEFSQSEPLGEINPSILNVNGGAIALGHPLAASGTRQILTTVIEMNLRNVQFGLVSACVGGGQGVAVILERSDN